MTEVASDIETILSDRDAFNSFVYIPWKDALEELERRQQSKEIEEYLKAVLPHGIPPVMRGKKNLVLFRHIATSNYEIHRFMAVADALDAHFRPLILEYTNDKFNDRNEGKYFLGKLSFHKGLNKNGEAIWENTRIVDFNASNNKPISSIETTWGQSLVELHHELFHKSFPKHIENTADISDWLRAFGVSAKDYYKPFLALFLRDGILFENFLLEKNELGFTQQVILPAIKDLIRESGFKPLIVALEPTEIEGDQFWYSHPPHDKQLINQKLPPGAGTIKIK